MVSVDKDLLEHPWGGMSKSIVLEVGQASSGLNLQDCMRLNQIELIQPRTKSIRLLQHLTVSPSKLTSASSTMSGLIDVIQLVYRFGSGWARSTDLRGNFLLPFILAHHAE